MDTKGYIKALSIILIYFFTAVGAQGTSFSDESEFQKVGFVKNKGANVRAGDNLNFEKLCQLEKGDPVRIVDKRYSWFEIMLPKTASIYIKNDYVDVDTENRVGIVNGLNVNLRAGPGTNYSILGQVSNPEELDVVIEENGWYKIIPPKGITGWIHYSQVTFSLDTLDGAEEQ